MLGVSYHWYGIDLDTGIRPLNSRNPLIFQYAKFGNETMHVLPTRAMSFMTRSGRRTT
jgi:hypothetical protein